MGCDVAELILQLFLHFTYVTAHSPTFPSLHPRHSSFSNPSVALPTSQLILQPFRCFTYVTAHSPTLLSLLLRHRAHSPTFPSLHLRHSSFSNPSVALLRHSSFSSASVASLTSRLILKLFFHFFYVTGSSCTSPGEPPMEYVVLKS